MKYELAPAEDPFGSLDLYRVHQRATNALASVAPRSRYRQVQRRIDLGDSHRTESGEAARRLICGEFELNEGPLRVQTV
jgi:hypothetical protein